jgi:dTDP-4-dehydrorhamnose 3,5-epimerase
MEFVETPLKGLYILKSDIKRDGRGLFTRTFCKKEFQKINFSSEFVQFNHSFNFEKGTLRGIHYQIPPFSESKLIRCIQGRVFDVAVDIRQGSPTFLQYFSVELSEENMYSILIPVGFAHGFQTLEANSALIYHHTQYFTQHADAGFRYDDPLVDIKWPLTPTNVSEKDMNFTNLNHFKGISL